MRQFRDPSPTARGDGAAPPRAPSEIATPPRDGRPDRRSVNGPLAQLTIAPPRAPDAGKLASRVLILALCLTVAFLFDRLTLVLMDYWLLESLGYETVFWTNFEVGAALFVVVLIGVAAAIAIPSRLYGLSSRARRASLLLGLIAGLLAGDAWAGNYHTYLGLFHSEPFGSTDPLFGNDISFYVFDLPAYEATLDALLLLLGLALVASVAVGLRAPGRPRSPSGMNAVCRRLAPIANGYNIALVALLGLVVAAQVWVSRYALLTRDNEESSILAGAEAIDVTGFFSTRNAIAVETIAVLLLTAALGYKLSIVRRATRDSGSGGWQRKLAPAALALAFVPVIVADVAFKSAVAIRDATAITPNEPVVQLPFIERHIEATRAAYGLDEVETTPFKPAGPGDPKPDVDRLLRSPTFQNAPLWPGYASHIERLIDPEYQDRVLAGGEDTTIYAPTLEAMGQQQKLRPYYDFMDVDTTRYFDGSEKRLLASAVRELPLLEPQPWLAWWGQRFVVFTHGYGLVAASLAAVSDAGDPEYVSSGIPARTGVKSLALDEEALYHGEGSGTMAYTNVEGVLEHDYPTAQDRAQVSFPETVEAGVEIDSPLKRLVFGWRSGQLPEVLFSDLIGDSTRVHYYRTPLDRIDRIAPFLYLDSDPYAVAADGRLTWMVNGMTTTDRYPYSLPIDLGDKSDRRTPTPRSARWVNYAADSVKVTVDGFSGQVRFYRIADEPVVRTWASMYPDLFEPADAMPRAVREQMQYPVQLMHTQFDDLYITYHVTDPLTFFSFEDAFDDADEVVGPILDEGDAVTFSIEPYYWLAETGGALPRSSEESQFALSTVYTPEGAKNLRALATAYQEGSDYGRLSVLLIPKGRFHPGPEQADAAIDQNPLISRQIGLWNRLGIEVIRGHTTPLVAGREVIYVEPLFIRSKQNPLPQLQRVIVVFRGEAAIGRNLEQALRAAIDSAPEAPIDP